jgi:hypothetical protein
LEDEKYDINNHQRPSRLRKLFHSLGLESFYLLGKEFQGHVVKEKRKVVLNHDLFTACYVSLLHVIPVAASVTLLVFNLRGFYIGGDLSGANGPEGTSIRLLILQFLSKALELLAVASLSCILFALIRHSLIHGGLPYGAITAGFEFTKLSMLWSKEFVATCSTGFDSRRTKVLLVATIVVFTVLGASLGPSFATTLQPTLQDFNGGGTSYYLPRDLWPLQVNEMKTSEVACSSSKNNSCFPPNHNLISDELLSYWPASWPPTEGYNLPQVMPEQILISGRHTLCELAVRFRGPFIYQPGLTAATTPSAAIADSVAKLAKYWTLANRAVCADGKSSFCFYKDIFFSVEALQPVVFANCNTNSVNSTLKFPKIDQGSGSFPLPEFENSTFTSQDWYNQVTLNGSTPSLTWVELPEGTFGLSSIGGIVALPGSNTTGPGGRIVTCTLDARWANSTVTVSFTGGPKVVRGEPPNWFTTSRLQKNSNGELKWPQINISPQWADYLDPSVEGLNISTFTLLGNSIGRLGNIALAPFSNNAVEAILAVILAEGLSRISNMATIQGSLKGFEKNEWMSQILPDKSVFGTGGSAFNYTFSSGGPFEKFEMKTAVNGYGYGITTATILSSLVLLTYSLIATVYVIHSTCFSRSTSSAWESISEVIALAMNSAPAPNLRNTGAGISSLKTLKEKVRIGVNDDEQLQMIFVDETEEGTEKEYGGVTPNESYG